MAIALVQSTIVTSGASSVTSQTGALGLALTAGNAVIVYAYVQTGATAAGLYLKDSLSNNYNLVCQPVRVGAAVCAMWIAHNVAGGAATLTLGSNPAAGIIFDIREYSGLATSNAVDKVWALEKFPAVTPTTTMGPTAAPTVQAVELVVAGIGCNLATQVITVGSGYGNFLTASSSINGSAAGTQDMQTAALGQFTAPFGMSSASATYYGIIATFSQVSVPQPTVMNNYQFLKVGDGMSTVEKIR